MKEQQWSSEKLLMIIKSLLEDGADLTYSGISKHDKRIYRAARREFGSWKKALESIGLDYEDYRHQKSKAKAFEYDKEIYGLRSIKTLDINTEKFHGFVYITINLINGKKYIGQSVFKRNWKTYLGSGVFISRAIKKYGKENFKRQIVELCYTQDELNVAEEKYISKFNACDNSNKEFYNVSSGGFGNTFIGQSEDKKNLIRKKISERAKKSTGSKNPNYGNRGESNPLSHKIIQINATDGSVVKEWGALIEITRSLGWHMGNISKKCKLVDEKNEWSPYKDFYWCYAEDYRKFDLKNKKSPTHHSYKQVRKICPKTGRALKEYSTVREAATDNNVSERSISRVCNGHGALSCGFMWEFTDQEFKRPKRKIREMDGANNHRARKIVQLDFKTFKLIKEWDCAKDAANELGLSQGALYLSLNRCAGASSGGYRWMHSEVYYNLNKEEMEMIIQKHLNNVRSIKNKYLEKFAIQ